MSFIKSNRAQYASSDHFHPEQIFTVYQPIVDKELNLRGTELLCRRLVNERIQLPGEFLQNMTVHFWKRLTSIMLDDAIDRINENKPFGYYTVNIPAALTGSKDLISLVICSLLRLTNLNNVSKLILEFSEDTCFQNVNQVGINVKELVELGLRIFSDDIFSPSLPAHMHLTYTDIPFNGFKIDMRAVWLSQQDFTMRRKIENLATYCYQNGLDCIAEGIQDYADVCLMASLGVDQYQGFLISPALKWDELASKSQELKQYRHKRC